MVLLYFGCEPFSPTNSIGSSLVLYFISHALFLAFQDPRGVEHASLGLSRLPF